MLAHLDPHSPAAAEAVEALRLARRTEEQAGGFEAELADIEAVAAHHANNYMPLVSRHWRQDRATMFAFVRTVELEVTSADRRVCQWRRGARHGPVAPITDALLTAIADLRYACRIIGHPLADRAHTAATSGSQAFHIDASLVTRGEILNGGASLDVV